MNLTKLVVVSQEIKLLHFEGIKVHLHNLLLLFFQKIEIAFIPNKSHFLCYFIYRTRNFYFLIMKCITEVPKAWFHFSFHIITHFSFYFILHFSFHLLPQFLISLAASFIISLIEQSLLVVSTYYLIGKLCLVV